MCVKSAMHVATCASRSLQGFLVLALLIGVLPPSALAQGAAAAKAEIASFALSALSALSLADAERLMLERNRELQAARRAREAARADSMVAAQGVNPVLTLQTFNINPRLGIGAGGPRDKTVDTTVRIDQIIERGEKRELRVAAAGRLEAASDADFLAARRQQQLVLRIAYYELALAQEKTLVLADTAGLFGKSLEAAERRLNAGDIARADLARLRVDALRAGNDARAAEADLARSQLALAYIVGLEGDAATLRATDAWPQADAAAPVATAATAELIDRRPDVRAAQARVEALERSRELARRLRTRDVSVGAQFEHWPQSAGNQQGSGNSVGFAVSVPLFVRHAYGGEIRRAEVEYDAARDALARIRAQAAGEFARAASDLRAASDRVRRYQGGLLEEARRSAEAAEYAYRNGALGIMDLLDARRTLRATQIDSAQARADHAKALAAWNASATPTE